MTFYQSYYSPRKYQETQTYAQYKKNVKFDKSSTLSPFKNNNSIKEQSKVRVHYQQYQQSGYDNQKQIDLCFFSQKTRKKLRISNISKSKCQCLQDKKYKQQQIQNFEDSQNYQKKCIDKNNNKHKNYKIIANVNARVKNINRIKVIKLQKQVYNIETGLQYQQIEANSQCKA